MPTRIAAALLACVSLSACVATSQVEPAGAASAPSPVAVQLLAINDFHGNLESPQGTLTYSDNGEVRQARLGGAAQLAATLAALRDGNTLTVAAGDLIGASPLVSALFLDEPAIRVLSEMGLDVASVGNHEFDRGTHELRRMASGGCERFTRREPCTVERFAGAGFAYLAANVVDEQTGETLLPGTAMREVGGARIGFIGMTLQGTPDLVAATATAGYTFLDEAETANRLASDLRAKGADAVVLLIHQGGEVDPRYNLAGCPGLGGEIVPIVDALGPDISVVVSGHTHLAYVCNMQTAAGGQVLLTSAGRYGAFITDIDLLIDPVQDRVLASEARNVPVPANGPQDEAIAAYVARYVEAAGPLANRQVGAIIDTGVEGENCLDTPAQDLVADAYLDAARKAPGEGADFAFVNSGGVRTDLSGATDGALTYGELAAMAPFNNGLLVLDMTGAQFAALLEAQWCDGEGQARPCRSVLIPSANVSYRVDPAAPQGQRVRQILLDGKPLDPARRYRVVTNSFLAGGGDGFAMLAAMPQLANVGYDIDALEAYVAQQPLTVPVCGRVQRD